VENDCQYGDTEETWQQYAEETCYGVDAAKHYDGAAETCCDDALAMTNGENAFSYPANEMSRMSDLDCHDPEIGNVNAAPVAPGNGTSSAEPSPESGPLNYGIRNDLQRIIRHPTSLYGHDPSATPDDQNLAISPETE